MRRLVCIVLAATSLAWTCPSFAQDDRIVPPEPIETDRAPYPAGGRGDATVLLELVVSEDGRIQSVSVAQGREPFASAARQAARSWRFAPAKRRGEAIVAKIRYEVTFEETLRPDPDPDRDGEDEPTTTQPAPEGKRDTGDVIEVAADEVARPPSVSSLRRSEIRRLPGAFGDPFRAIEVLPGVTPIVSGLPFFYVRGAPPGNVGYFLDGVRVPYLFHVAAGPSVVHPALVERVDLYSGGYPARFGRYAGAIVSAETTEPRADWHGEGNIRIVDAGALVEGGFLDGRGRALIAGRYSYTAALFSLLSPEITLDYRDFQGRFSFDITDRDRISVFTFGSYDYLSDTSADGVETVLFGSEFYRVDTRYDARLSSGGKLRAAVTAGFDRTRVADGRNTRSVLVNSRVRLSEPLTTDVTLRAGFDMQLDDYRADERQYTDPDNPETAAYNALFPPRSDSAAATWADVVWQLSPQLEVTPGIRVDGYYSNGAKAVAADPRLAVTARVHERVRLLHAIGIAHQPPSFVVPVPGLAVANLNGGLQRAFQASSGVEVALPWDTTASVTAFTGVYENMTDTISLNIDGDPSTQLPRSLGAAKGLEVYIRRSLSSRIGGFVAYTFSRTTRSIDDQHRPAAFDRAHVLHTAASFDLTSGWRAGTRVSVISGAPRLLPLGFPTGLVDTGGVTRDPVFYRVDFRVEKRWAFTDTVWLSLVIEMLNATLNTDVIDGSRVGPVTIPSIGVEGGF